MRLLPLFSTLLLSTGLAPVLSGCGKEVFPTEKLPAATEQGLNEAGCLVNGDVWRPYSVLFGPKAIDVSVIRNRAFYAPNGSNGFQLSISMLRLPQEDRTTPNTNTNTNINLYVPIVERVGRFALTDFVPRNFPGDWPAYASFSRTEAYSFYYTGSGTPPAKGELFITRFDTVARVISGTFDFTAGQTSSPEQIRVTEGRFDVRY
ncbi:hypothetical protein J7E24_07960 [Hymenobacter sp. ISL-91]|uniref:DUF6252 family protein n=1 Tax=Hymenobacter sp. ISL-91 TaxID=2819151 RepID=UPI001BECDAFB|nr:DUF6252 family protein [Hymenobacter sp. ISL-91]MBT2557715.1 hypothetical protein [Hymenobacter sp. ISL-91]